MSVSVAERIAKEFHDTYEKLAPQFGWNTQTSSRKPWADVPKENKLLMIEVIHDLMDRGIIEIP